MNLSKIQNLHPGEYNNNNNQNKTKKHFIKM